MKRPDKDPNDQYVVIITADAQPGMPMKVLGTFASWEYTGPLSCGDGKVRVALDDIIELVMDRTDFLNFNRICAGNVIAVFGRRFYESDEFERRHIPSMH